MDCSIMRPSSRLRCLISGGSPYTFVAYRYSPGCTERKNGHKNHKASEVFLKILVHNASISNRVKNCILSFSVRLDSYVQYIIEHSPNLIRWEGKQTTNAHQSPPTRCNASLYTWPCGSRWNPTAISWSSKGFNSAITPSRRARIKIPILPIIGTLCAMASMRTPLSSVSRVTCCSMASATTRMSTSETGGISDGTCRTCSMGSDR
jgi:hypothetical protein